MSKFKIGDRVKVVSPPNRGIVLWEGECGTIISVNNEWNGYTVRLDRRHIDGVYGYSEDELELDSIKTNFGMTPQISPHYTTDSTGKDFLQRFFETKSPEAVHGAMTFLMGKYIDRLGKKDAPEKELAKIIDYATRYRDFLNK